MSKATIKTGRTDAVMPIAVTLRDFMAAAALTGIIARSRGSGLVYDSDWALGAYRMADAMLSAREAG